MLLETLKYGAWVLSSLLLLLTAWRLRRRGHLPRLRIFFVYVLFVALHSLFNLALSRVDPTWWFYSFYIGGFISTLLGFLVLYEVARNTICVPWIKVEPVTFAGLCALAAGLAVIVAAHFENSGAGFMHARIVLEAALRIMQIAILLVFTAVSMFFGVLWRRSEFGIVLGYGFYAAAQLAVMYLRPPGSRLPMTFVVIPLLTYCVSSAIWLTYATLSEPFVAADLEVIRGQVRDSHAALERLDRC